MSVNLLSLHYMYKYAILSLHTQPHRCLRWAPGTFRIPIENAGATIDWLHPEIAWLSGKGTENKGSSPTLDSMYSGADS